MALKVYHLHRHQSVWVAHERVHAATGGASDPGEEAVAPSRMLTRERGVPRVGCDLRVQLSQYPVSQFHGSVVVKPASALGTFSSASHLWPAVVCVRVTKKVVHSMNVQPRAHQCAHGYTAVAIRSAVW